MNIASLLQANTAGLTGNGSTASPFTSATGTTSSSPLDKVVQRIQASVDSTSAQISAMGSFKSSVAQLQSVAKTLSNLSTTSTADNLTQTAASLFNTFNAAIAAATKTGPAASGASRDLQRALQSSPALSDAMHKLGLGVQSDGTLQHNAKQFAAALAADPAGVRTALQKLGQQLNTVAGKELASDGKLSTALATLNQRNTALAAQQKALRSAIQSTPTTTSLAAYLANS